MTHLGSPPAAGGTHRSETERKRDWRARKRAGLLFASDDWQVFLDPANLPQKAGCQPAMLRRIILRELVDNALDTGANATLDRDGAGWVVSDDGSGIDPAEVPRLFAVNRPLLSGKRLRLPLRGMLGNGLRVVMGGVAASGGDITVTTRGQRLRLTVDPATGLTQVSSKPAAARPGLRVRLTFAPHLPPADVVDDDLARLAIEIAQHGTGYDGPSSPWWYGPADLHNLLTTVTPPTTTVAELVDELGSPSDDQRRANSLTLPQAEALLKRLRAAQQPVAPERLGQIGPDYGGHHALKAGTVQSRGAEIPFVIEAWATCSKPEQRSERHRAEISLLLNRTPSAANILAASFSDQFGFQGCGLKRRIFGMRGGEYAIHLSVIAPHIDLATDGKEPSLGPFSEAIVAVIKKAGNAAHRAMERPERGLEIKAAAWLVMQDAYMAASTQGRLPANARQIMYAARPAILRLTKLDKFGDKYFTQTLLPDYLETHPDETADWDVVFDARGHFVEPHTGRSVPLGTIAVREYLGDRPPPERAAAVDPGAMYPTVGPEHRYSTALFIEKEGFGPLLEAAGIAERFDIAALSTKGTSVTAARLLLDRLAARGVKRVLVLRDFDLSGFSIIGTLGKSSHRYRFANKVEIVDLGLRLTDVRALGLEGEPIPEIEDDEWVARAATLHRHGATAQEINYLRTQRVELNAMPTDVFVAFLERKLAEFGARKLVPDREVIESHARSVLSRALANRRLDAMRAEIDAEAAAVRLPADLRAQVTALLKREPELPWDLAVARIVQRGAR